MSPFSTQKASTTSASTGARVSMLRWWQGARFHLSDNISPARALLVVFYTVVLVGGLLQSDFSPGGKLTSPHSHDSGLAEVSETEAESKAETKLLALTPNWMVPTFEITAIPVVSERQPATCIQKHTVSLLRGPPVV